MSEYEKQKSCFVGPVTLQISDDMIDNNCGTDLWDVRYHVKIKSQWHKQVHLTQQDQT